jgi:uncharacterized membrane protein
MVRCKNCETEFEGRFCPKCGTAGGIDTASPLQTPAVAGLPSNWASVLCYVVPIAGPLVFLFLAPYNRDTRIRFNAWQALFLQGVWIAAHIVANIFGAISWHVEYALHQMIGWAFFAVTLVMAIKAYQGEKLVLPVIGPLAEKQK